ncbi:MAG TPA: 50S ribosomal protein L3 N(5)-glutamine methyltransferase [Rubrivivax sp.]|nr:50S ribosomal protein L3 N(5)-glutamine methyltransferase [Rubrivivax sp.]
MTLIETVERAAARLDAAGVRFGHGTDNAFDEAAWLVLWRLGLPLHALDEAAARELSADDAAAVDALVAQRIATRRPAAYLTGEAWLHGLPFFVDERVIVPRSPIAEVIVEGLAEPWLAAPPQRILDLCTGNGSLAVFAALAWPQARVDATDVSADALAVAARNVERHGLASRVRLRRGDGLAAAEGRYELVLCNPPYVTRAAMQALPDEYRAEPALALAGGDDGMDVVRALLPALPAHLAPGGVLLLEVGHERAHFEAAFPRLQPLWIETSAGADAVLLLTAEDLA